MKTHEFVWRADWPAGEFICKKIAFYERALQHRITVYDFRTAVRAGGDKRAPTI